ncbi:hypothetical protein, partial [Liquorilactobacillus uvarum]|uniref:hypothetical protein n=1 Tax=Liquorilactobacillus uvarum TaxID=303240 RepID=UPI000AA79750
RKLIFFVRTAFGLILQSTISKDSLKRKERVSNIHFLSLNNKYKKEWYRQNKYWKLGYKPAIYLTNKNKIRRLKLWLRLENQKEKRGHSQNAVYDSTTKK